MSEGVHGEADLSAEFQKHLKGMLVCCVCGPFHRFPSGKTHKSRSKHAMRKLTPEERAEEIAWYREIEADGEAARIRQLDKKRRQSRDALQGQGASTARSSADSVGGQEDNGQVGDYVLDFGKHKGKTVTAVWKKDKTYLPYLINGKALDARIRLKRAMESVGILEEAQAMADVMKVEKAHKVLARDS